MSSCEASSQCTVLLVLFWLTCMDDDIGVETDFAVSCVGGCETNIELNGSVVPLLMDMDKRRASRSACSIDNAGKRFIVVVPVVCLAAASWFGGPRLSVGFVSLLFRDCRSAFAVAVPVAAMTVRVSCSCDCVYGCRCISLSPRSFSVICRHGPDQRRFCLCV